MLVQCGKQTRFANFLMLILLVIWLATSSVEQCLIGCWKMVTVCEFSFIYLYSTRCHRCLMHYGFSSISGTSMCTISFYFSYLTFYPRKIKAWVFCCLSPLSDHSSIHCVFPLCTSVYVNNHHSDLEILLLFPLVFLFVRHCFLISLLMLKNLNNCQ